MLSTVPCVLKRLNRAMPEKRTRYFDALSTLVWCCSSTFPVSNCCSSSRWPMRTSTGEALPAGGIEDCSARSDSSSWRRREISARLAVVSCFSCCTKSFSSWTSDCNSFNDAATVPSLAAAAGFASCAAALAISINAIALTCAPCGSRDPRERFMFHLRATKLWVRALGNLDGRHADRGHTGQGDAHHRASRRRFFHPQLAGVVLDDFLCDGQSQPGAVFLSMTHKGMEYPVTDRRVETRPVIDDANVKLTAAVLHRDRHVATACLHRLT